MIIPRDQFYRPALIQPTRQTLVCVFRSVNYARHLELLKTGAVRIIKTNEETSRSDSAKSRQF